MSARTHSLSLFRWRSLAGRTSLGGQEDKTKATAKRLRSQQAQDGGLGMPTPTTIHRPRSVVPSGQINWSQTFRKVAVDMDPDHFTEKDVASPMELGVRIADGVMAVKARDVG